MCDSSGLELYRTLSISSNFSEFEEEEGRSLAYFFMLPIDRSSIIRNNLKMIFVFNDPTRRKTVNNEPGGAPSKFLRPLLSNPCSSALVFFVFSSLSRENSSQGSAAVQDIGETENKEERKEERKKETMDLDLDVFLQVSKHGGSY